jgi:SAM-dependent methyltransferase
MMKDPYHNVAGIHDRPFESMNKGLRLVGIRMFRPAKGMNILDVGCGTGTHLDLYRRYECNLYGLDTSPSMLDVQYANQNPLLMVLTENGNLGLFSDGRPHRSQRRDSIENGRVDEETNRAFSTF